MNGVLLVPGTWCVLYYLVKPVRTYQDFYLHSSRVSQQHQYLTITRPTQSRADHAIRCERALLVPRIYERSCFLLFIRKEDDVARIIPVSYTYT